MKLRYLDTFVVVRYGTQERRTQTQVETVEPEWKASFVFEEDENAEEIVFMFFHDEISTGLTDLFGYVAIPLKDPEHPVRESLKSRENSL